MSKRRAELHLHQYLSPSLLGHLPRDGHLHDRGKGPQTPGRGGKGTPDLGGGGTPDPRQGGKGTPDPKGGERDPRPQEGGKGPQTPGGGKGTPNPRGGKGGRGGGFAIRAIRINYCNPSRKLPTTKTRAIALVLVVGKKSIIDSDCSD